VAAAHNAFLVPIDRERNQISQIDTMITAYTVSLTSTAYGKTAVRRDPHLNWKLKLVIVGAEITSIASEWNKGR
jgi:hypothetical protein